MAVPSPEPQPIPEGGTGDKIRLREATPKDFKAISALFQEVDNLHCEHLPDLFRRAEGAPREESFIIGLIRNPDALVLVAEHEARILGLVVALTRSSPGFPYLVPLRYAVIDTIVVTASARGRGIGQAMMAFTEAWASDQGVDRIELDVFEFNEEALSFYQGREFSVLSRRMVKLLDRDTC